MFIDKAYIESLLEKGKTATETELEKILDKAESLQGLNEREVAALIGTADKKYNDRIFKIAGKIKQHIYGDRIVMFAPLYVSDHCVNKCDYCGFRCDNQFERRVLSREEIRNEVRVLEKMGHKRLAIEAGEHPKYAPIEYILDCMDTIYSMQEEGEIRRCNVNIAATTVENYKKLKDAKIGTYILFQETYDGETYGKRHLAGPKSNYEYHLTAFDRAMEAGIEDVGGGVLFGLYKPDFEVMGLMLHNKHLEDTYGVGFHTISVPRICAAEGVDREKFPYAQDDDEFLRLVAIIRIAVPFTGMIISTRESKEMRRKLIKIGISQISAGSSVDVGGYSERENQKGQFSLADNRSANEIISWLMDEELIPSFCTACYRGGRTGDRFMQLAKSGNIKNVCLPNALMTLYEYALDYGDGEFKEKTDTVIARHIETIQNEKIRTQTKANLTRLKNGERDLFF